VAFWALFCIVFAPLVKDSKIDGAVSRDVFCDKPVLVYMQGFHCPSTCLPVHVLFVKPYAGDPPYEELGCPDNIIESCRVCLLEFLSFHNDQFLPPPISYYMRL
jgi:hypothetical protein